MTDTVHDNEFKPFHLSVAQGIRQVQSNNTYGKVSEIKNVDDLRQAVQFDHVAGIFKDNHRRLQNFIEADAVIMDCDNERSDNPQDWLTPDKLSLKLHDVIFYSVYSRNHMKDKEGKSARPRFHAYLPLSTTYRNADAVRKLKEQLLQAVHDFDAGAKDTARFIYGVEKPLCEFHFGHVCIDDFLEAILNVAAVVKDNSSKEHDDNDSDVIHVGERNTTVFYVARQAISKYGISDKARKIFDNACAFCRPPLPDSEVNKTWDSAIKISQNSKDTKHELLMSMRSDFLEGRHIFFHGTIKGGLYYEYQPAGFWVRMTDASMQSELSKHFGHSKSNKDISNLSMMIRLMTTKHSMPLFNSKRLWLFQNGVLDLDTGILRNPMPDDYLTWQVSYGYDEDATCPTFDNFMQQITLNEASRLDFLDDVMGYIPYEDNRLEKIFVLIGEGMNGKGTFLNVIENLVRNVNSYSNGFQSYTNIPLYELTKPTQIIMLDGSIVNLSYDLNENLKGCESALKSIASGDTISGNRKFCDTVSFTPRCKMICASNHMLKLRDDSYGMRRRLMFCRFANSFEGRENTKLKKQLTAELPGIFNRMYRAYKKLIEREKEFGSRAIRPCIDNDEFITEFTQIANPVAAFWADFKDEYISRGEVKKSDIFDAFRAFCERNSRYAGDERIFYKNLKKVANDDGITIKDTRHREEKKQIYYCQFMSSGAIEANAQKYITLDDVLNDDLLEIDA